MKTTEHKHRLQVKTIQAVRCTDCEWSEPATSADVERAATLAWNEAVEACAKEAEDLGRGWGVLRSLKMTHFADAATRIADHVRALKREAK